MTEDAMVREAVGVFDDEQRLQAAADELMTSGFDRADLSVLAEHDDVARHLGHDFESVAELEDDPDVATNPLPDNDARVIAEGAMVGVPFFVGVMVTAVPILAYGGWVATAVIWGLVGGVVAGAIGFVFSRWLAWRHRRYVQDQLNHGGLLLWVRTPDRTQERKACDILRQKQAKDVHIHDRPHVDHPVDHLPYLDWLSGVRGPTASHGSQA